VNWEEENRRTEKKREIREREREREKKRLGALGP